MSAAEMRTCWFAQTILIFTVLLIFLPPRGAAAAMEDAAARVSVPQEAEVTRAIRMYSAYPAGIPGKGPPVYLGGVTPHHGLALGMMVRFYDRIASRAVRRVWLLSPDHFNRARKYAVFCDADWALRPGTTRVDRDACAALGSLPIAGSDSSLFRNEHGITIHIPLIARYFPNAKVVPMVLKSDIPDIGILILKKKILEIMDDDDVIILSMDLSHYKTPEGMAAEDARTVPALEKLDWSAADTLDIDARRAASLVLRLFKDRGAVNGEILEHTDSSAILGKRVESGTSYATVVYGK